MTKLEQLRKLAEAATPGPWYHCQPFQSVSKQTTIHGPVPAQRVDFVSTEKEPVHKKIVLPMQGREANIRSEDMAFIAAANPQTIRALLDLVDKMYSGLLYAADAAPPNGKMTCYCDICTGIEAYDAFNKE